VSEALVIVDYQNDFNPGGALAVAGGDEIAGRINALAADDRFALVLATRDWHPADHSSFAERGGTWPVHCVAGTPGAELHPALVLDNLDGIVDKGQDRDTEGYSGFQATDLEQRLRDAGVDRVTVVGLATDYCVKQTALDALRDGFGVTVDTSAVRGVNVQPGDSERALDELREAGATIA
jgi:nicotinamidase/pyrazinamidase